MSVLEVSRHHNGVAEVVISNPPVNALPVAGWFELAGTVSALGADTDVRAVILRADGRGFNAGVDIKEMQNTEGFQALVGANRGCFAAFAAVYECAVPVIAAVHGYCLGGGIGLAGNADVIIASDDATFGLPEVDRGALGAATHLSRLVPLHKMRAMVYTSATANAAELFQYGSVFRVVPREQLVDAAREVAAQIAAKRPGVIRAAKESLNGIDPVDVRRSYRYEQGFTFELNLLGHGDQARDDFIERGRDSGRLVGDLRDKRLSEEDVVAELADGMTVGVGGWGSRRKPMSIVRAIARSDLRDLTLVSYGGPDVGILCAAGKVKKVVYAFVSLDTIALDPHFRHVRQAGLVEDEPWDEGLFLLGLQAAAWRVPFLPSRVGLGSDLLRLNPRLATVRSPFADAEDLVAAPALSLDAALCHLDRADARGNAAFLGPDLYFDDLFLGAAAGRRFISTEKVVETGGLLSEAGTELRLRVNRSLVDGVVERAGGAHFTECRPDYRRDESFQRRYAAAAASPEAWDAFRAEWIDPGEDEYQSRRLLT